MKILNESQLCITYTKTAAGPAAANFLAAVPRHLLGAHAPVRSPHSPEIRVTILAMPDVRPHQAEAAPGRSSPEALLLAGVLAAAKAALPQGLDLLVWGAARLGDQATLRHLLSNGGGCSWTPSNDDEVWGRDTCLGVASRFGNEGAVKELLESGVDVDEGRADNGATPLYLAAQEGHEDVTDQLLKAGADVNKAMTDNGATPLWIAAEKGNEGVVEQLMKAGADVNKARTDNGVTPLSFAAYNGHEAVVEKLLKAGADSDTEPSPLIDASSNGYNRICSLLLKAGANVNHVSEDGDTALQDAVTHGHRDVALVLMEHGASDDTLTRPMMKDLTKWTAEALKEKTMAMAEKDKQMEEMVRGIPEWCAQAASAVAEQEENSGDGNGSSIAPAEVQPVGVGRKRKAPSATE